MTNPQGTKWETEIVLRATQQGMYAGRYPKMAQGDEPDVWIGHASVPSADVTIPLVMWKRLVGVKKDGPRRPDGERDVVVMSYNDFLTMAGWIAEEAPVRFRYEVQAKWTAALNVTRTLAGLRRWMKEHR